MLEKNNNGPFFSLWRKCFFAFLIVSMVLSLLPIGGGGGFAGQDKILHSLNYALLYTLGWLAFPGVVFQWRLFVNLFFYGVLIEVLQYFLPHRQMEFWDVVANALGLGLASCSIFGWQYFSRQRF